MRKSKMFAALGALGWLALSTVAHAQAKPDAYTYDFEPDDLMGEAMATTPALLKIRPVPPKIMLLRPRASFVAEMLKSVEVL
jgi:hypothetical protein